MDDLVTILWVDLDGNLVEHDVPREVVEKMESGETVTWRSSHAPRRYAGELAIAALEARNEQIRKRLAELASEGQPDG